MATDLIARAMALKGGGIDPSEIDSMKTDIQDNKFVISAIKYGGTYNGLRLSNNNYTTTEKNKLASLVNYDDTDIKNSILSIQNVIASFGLIKITNLTVWAETPTIYASWDEVKVEGFNLVYKIYVYDANGKFKASKVVTTNSASLASGNLFHAGVTYKVKVWAIVNDIAQEISETTVTMPETETVE